MAREIGGSDICNYFGVDTYDLEPEIRVRPSSAQLRDYIRYASVVFQVLAEASICKMLGLSIVTKASRTFWRRSKTLKPIPRLFRVGLMCYTRTPGNFTTAKGRAIRFGNCVYLFISLISVFCLFYIRRSIG